MHSTSRRGVYLKPLQLIPHSSASCIYTHQHEFRLIHVFIHNEYHNGGRGGGRGFSGWWIYHMQLAYIWHARQTGIFLTNAAVISPCSICRISSYFAHACSMHDTYSHVQYIWNLKGHSCSFQSYLKCLKMTTGMSHILVTLTMARGFGLNTSKSHSDLHLIKHFTFECDL